MRTLVRGLILLALASPLCFAQQPPDSWENLNQLQAGQKIEVLDMNLKSLKGKFAGVSEDAISLQVGSDQVTVPRSEVLRVSLREGSRRGRNALVGMAVGAAAGVGVAALSAAFSERIGFDPAIRRGIPVFAGAGAGLGATFPSYQTLYRAKKLLGSSPP